MAKDLTDKPDDRPMLIHENPYFRIRQVQVLNARGEVSDFFVIDAPPSVFIVALSEANEIYLITLHRHTTQQESIEVPAGGAESVNFLEEAKRELQEETGLTSNDWVNLGTLQAANGSSSQLATVFLAKFVTQSHTHKQQDEGIVEVKKTPFSEVMNMIKDGVITDSGSISAIMLAYLYLIKLDEFLIPPTVQKS